MQYLKWMNKSGYNSFSEDSNNSFHALQSYISHIQRDLNTFLLQEEAQMEERVR